VRVSRKLQCNTASWYTIRLSYLLSTRLESPNQIKVNRITVSMWYLAYTLTYETRHARPYRGNYHCCQLWPVVNIPVSYLWRQSWPLSFTIYASRINPFSSSALALIPIATFCPALRKSRKNCGKSRCSVQLQRSRQRRFLSFLSLSLQSTGNFPRAKGGMVRTIFGSYLGGNYGNPRIWRLYVDLMISVRLSLVVRLCHSCGFYCGNCALRTRNVYRC